METELGRVAVEEGSRFRRRSGDSGEVVSARMVRWKERVEREQSITVCDVSNESTK